MKYSKKELLLNWVSCSGYLKKISDGAHISRDIDKEGILRFYFHENHKPRLLKGAGDGGVKIYHEIVPINFKGVVIGIKEKEIASFLYIAEDDDESIPDEVPFDRRIKVKKDIIEKIPCAIVAYANNRKRVVPFDCIDKILNVETVEDASVKDKFRVGGTQLTWLSSEKDEDEPF